MRTLAILCIVAALIVAGCATPQQPSSQPGTPVEPGQGTPQKTCRMVDEQVPVTVQNCTNISFTEQVCTKKKLAYTATLAPQNDLCIEDGDCVGKHISNCASTCQRIMSRCILTLQNLDPELAGKWKVGANFTLTDSAFIKTPVSATIEPNMSYAFDFHQIYTPQTWPVTTATCNLYVMEEAVVDDCHDETRLDQKCEDLTTYETRQKQVCN